MSKTKKDTKINPQKYRGDPWLYRLARAAAAFEAMESDRERDAAFTFLTNKYDWEQGG